MYNILSVSLGFSLFLCISLSVFLSFCLSAGVSICLSIYVVVWLSDCLSVSDNLFGTWRPLCIFTCLLQTRTQHSQNRTPSKTAHDLGDVPRQPVKYAAILLIGFLFYLNTIQDISIFDQNGTITSF